MTPGATEIVIQRIPIVGLPELACIVLVNAAGHAFNAAGDPINGDRECGRDGNWLLGAAAICEGVVDEAKAMVS